MRNIAIKIIWYIFAKIGLPKEVQKIKNTYDTHQGFIGKDIRTGQF